MKVFVLRGPPGCGKSTWVRENHHNAVVCSADHYFTGSDGVYRFRPEELPQAHGQCLRMFVQHCLLGAVDELVVDNTSSSVAEAAPYMALASAYGHQAVLVEFRPEGEGTPQHAESLRRAAARNVHGVPELAVVRMADRIFMDRPPPFWAVETVLY